MYYPILRARQFELITLRELAKEEITQDIVVPIIEPVKKVFNNLDLAFGILKEFKQKTVLILNPQIGELAGDRQNYAQYFQKLNNEYISPALIYHNNSKYIRKLIQNYNLKKCVLICPNYINTEDTEFGEIVKLDNVLSLILEDPSKNRDLNRFLRSQKKNYVRLDNLFEKKKRNSEFLPINGHRFSEEHKYFKEEGFSGFSDYTILPCDYQDGGSTPRAVVIHLTYLNSKNQIWIRHFTSITNDSISNVQGKFAEAAKKAVDFCERNNFDNSAISELKKYYHTEHYPGLGTIKKISIKNHIQIVVEYLRNHL